MCSYRLNLTIENNDDNHIMKHASYVSEQYLGEWFYLSFYQNKRKMTIIFFQNNSIRFDDSNNLFRSKGVQKAQSLADFRSCWTFLYYFKMARCNEILKEYLKNSSLHGVRFLIDEEISFFERLFWLLSVILSWIGSGVLIMSALDAFHNNVSNTIIKF